MTNDVAAFDKDALEAIYGPTPQCFLCPRYRANDFHHNFKRQHGPKETRRMFSSVYNAVPLSRDLHDTCPFLSDSGFQQVLFAHSVKHVDYAIARGVYMPTEADVAFLEWVRSSSPL